jgi:hypothetical protein
MEKTGISDYQKAQDLLRKYGSVKKAVDAIGGR